MMNVDHLLIWFMSEGAEEYTDEMNFIPGSIYSHPRNPILLHCNSFCGNDSVLLFLRAFIEKTDRSKNDTPTYNTQSLPHLGKLLQAPGREQRMAVKARAERNE